MPPTRSEEQQQKTLTLNCSKSAPACALSAVQSFQLNLINKLIRYYCVGSQGGSCGYALPVRLARPSLSFSLRLVLAPADAVRIGRRWRGGQDLWRHLERWQNAYYSRSLATRTFFRRGISLRDFFRQRQSRLPFSGFLTGFESFCPLKSEKRIFWFGNKKI